MNNRILFFIMIISLVLGIFLVLVNRKIANRYTKSLLVLVGIALVGYALYLFWPHQVA